jgi:hypothetical protein
MKYPNLRQIATIAEIGAAVGVMASVIYLGIQIEGSNKQLQAQSSNDTLQMLHKPLELVVQDPQLSDLVLRADTEPALLTPGEWNRYSALMMLKMDAFEHAYYANQSGEIRNELWTGIATSLTEEFRSSIGFRKFWEQHGNAFAEPFHGYVKARFHEHEP